MAVSQRIHALKSFNVLHDLFAQKRRLSDQHDRSFDIVFLVTFGGTSTQNGPKIAFFRARSALDLRHLQNSLTVRPREMLKE